MSSLEMSSTYGSPVDGICGSLKGENDDSDFGLMMTCPDSSCKRKLPVSEMFEHALKDHDVPLLEGTFGDVEVEFKMDPSAEPYKRKVWICAVMKGHNHQFVIAIETNSRTISLIKIFPFVVTLPVSKKLWFGLKHQEEENEIKYAMYHKCIPATQSMATAFINGDFIILHENHLKAYGKKTMGGGIKCNFKFHIMVRDCSCKQNADPSVSRSAEPKVEDVPPSANAVDEVLKSTPEDEKVNVDGVPGNVKKDEDCASVAEGQLAVVVKVENEEQDELSRIKEEEETERVLAEMLFIPPPSRSS